MNEELNWSSYDFTKVPLDKIVKFGQRSLLYNDLFAVSWILGRKCNYQCSYCWSYARSDTYDFRPLELCKITIDSIKQQARERNYNSFHFSLSGGEPTMHPNYLDIVQYLNDDANNCNYHSIHMTTNLSQGMKWFEKYINASKDLHRVSITASWHREQGIKKNDLERFKIGFADKLCMLQEHNVQVTINIVMVPTNFSALYDEALYFHSRGINVTLKPQSNDSASAIVEGYTNDMLQKLYNGMPQRDFTRVKAKIDRPKSKINNVRNVSDDKSVPSIMQIELEDAEGNRFYFDQAERFNSFNFNQFTNWNCESGYRSIVIREPDGAIKRSYSCHDKPLGYIETGFTLFDKVEKCISPSCVSSADSKIPKWK